VRPNSSKQQQTATNSSNQQQTAVSSSKPRQGSWPKLTKRLPLKRATEAHRGKKQE